MANSSRAREAFFASHVGLFRSVVEVDPHTAVPDDNLVHHLADEVKSAPAVPVMCVLSTSPAPLVEDRSTTGNVTAAGAELTPYYDVARRQLSLGQFVLKQFNRPAGNQETIVKVFQEEGWPPKIDDPLSGETLGPIKRLHDTLDALNKTIEKESREAGAPYWVKFKTDGTGQGVKWKIVWPTIATFAANKLMRNGVQGPGFRVRGSGFRVRGSGFGVQGSGKRHSAATDVPQASCSGALRPSCTRLKRTCCLRETYCCNNSTCCTVASSAG